jgi:hypothetical protein
VSAGKVKGESESLTLPGTSSENPTAPRLACRQSVDTGRRRREHARLRAVRGRAVCAVVPLCIGRVHVGAVKGSWVQIRQPDRVSVLRFPQVIPEGAAPVQVVSVPVLCPSSPSGDRAELRRRGQGSGVARPRSGRRALRPAPFGACCGRRRRRGVWGSCCKSGVRVDGALIKAGVPVGGSRRVGLLVIPSPRGRAA